MRQWERLFAFIPWCSTSIDSACFLLGYLKIIIFFFVFFFGTNGQLEKPCYDNSLFIGLLEEQVLLYCVLFISNLFIVDNFR